MQKMDTEASGGLHVITYNCIEKKRWNFYGTLPKLELQESTMQDIVQDIVQDWSSWQKNSSFNHAGSFQAKYKDNI